MAPVESRAASVIERLPTGLTVAVAVYLLVATTVGFHWLDSWHDEQRAAQVVLLALTSLVAAWLVVARPLLVAPRFALAVFAVFALGLVSSALSDRPHFAFAEVSLFGLLCALAVVVAAGAMAAGLRAVRWVCRVALFIAATHLVGALTRYAAAIGLEHSLGVEIWLVGFSNPRVASSFYALMIPFIATATLPQAEPDRRLRISAWIVVAGLWTVATGLEARALWLAYALAMPLLLGMAWTPMTRRVAATIGGAALAGIALQFALQVPFSTGAVAALGSSRELASLSARDILWRLAFDAIVESPAFGIGPGQFTRFESYAGAHPHNWALQLASEWGLPALLAALFGLSGLVARLRPGLRDEERPSPVLVAASLSVMIGLASALVDGTLVMPVTQIQFALAFGLMIGSAGSGTRGALASLGYLARVGVAGAILAAAFVLCAHAARTYPVQAAERAAFQKHFPGQWLIPRFWENGLTLTHSSEPNGR